MLIGSNSRRANLQRIRAVKDALREAMRLPDDTVMTVAELACLDNECAPVETVFGLLAPGSPQQQFKLHKPVDDIDDGDLVRVCSAWGFDVHFAVFAPLFSEKRRD